MSIEVLINKEKFKVNNDEFNIITHYEYNNLKILNKLGYFEKIVSFINDLREIGISQLYVANSTHGGYVPIKCASSFDKVLIYNKNDINIIDNIKSHNIENIHHINNDTQFIEKNDFIMYCENSDEFNIHIIKKHVPILIIPSTIHVKLSNIYKHILILKDTDLSIYIPQKYYYKFLLLFRYYILEDDPTTLNYDNLIHLCIMVKNGGEQFKQMLLDNLPIIDRWTILDTGSTDNTIEIIKNVLINKKGNLYEEKFIDFSQSRNRCIELAGKSCKFILTLDDTYRIKGDLRKFLNIVRGDQFSDSFSMYIQSEDIEYVSNRIIKSECNLKYIFKIHETIQEHNNNNVIIPNTSSFIFDFRCDYMEERTMNRKQEDLKLLQEEIDFNPHEPRHYYYMAQTYNLLGDYDNAYKYFMLRLNHIIDGFKQEKIDACFELARISNFKLNKSWQECFQLYHRAYEMDTTRPESLYFIGIHYYTENNAKLAYYYFKKAFDIGYPIHCQYSLKPTLSYYYLPLFLCELCYEFNDYNYGISASKLFLEKNNDTSDKYTLMMSWNKLFNILNNPNLLISTMPSSVIIKENKKYCCIIGENVDINSNLHLLIQNINKNDNNNHAIFLFCKETKITIVNNITYLPIDYFYTFMKNNIIDIFIVIQNTEYIHLPIKLQKYMNNFHKIYFIVENPHNCGMIIPMNENIKIIIDDIQKNTFLTIFPQFVEKNNIVGYDYIL